MPCRPLHLAPIIILLLSAGSVAYATPVLIDSSFSASHFIDNENGANDDDDYSMILERLRLRSTAKGVTAGFRLDNTIFLGKKGPRRTEARLERIYANIERGRFRITAGDFYKQLFVKVASGDSKPPSLNVCVDAFEPCLCPPWSLFSEENGVVEPESSGNTFGGATEP